MESDVLLVKLEGDEDGSYRVLAPGVGVWSEHPHAGALVGPGTRLGTIQVLNKLRALVLPDGPSGRITDGLPRDRAVAVEYGQVLFRLMPVGAGEPGELVTDASIAGPPLDPTLPAGCRAVVSPSDGVFYTRPSPDARPFVEPGAKVRPGQAVGLVEVMKTFNQILYGGPGFPEQAEVVEVRPANGEEVRAGQVLVVVR